MTRSLGEELSDSLTNITALIVATKSKQQRTQLTQIQAQIAGELQTFVDEIVDNTLPEYVAATEALKKANAEAKAAKEDLDRVAEAIKKFATAIDTLVELAAIVGAA